MRLIISQEQSQNPQLAAKILFCPDVSAGHFKRLFRAL